MAGATYRVRYVYDREADTWTGELVEMPQVHTHGRSLEQLRNRIREALWAWTTKRHAEEAVLIDEMRSPT